jgi:hypothetical protein
MFALMTGAIGVVLFAHEGALLADARAIANRLEGRVLGSQIKTGMTKGEVAEILPERSISGLGGTSISQFASYHEYQLIVFYKSDRNFVFRVKEVRFRPLIKPEEWKRLARGINRMCDFLFPVERLILNAAWSGH